MKITAILITFALLMSGCAFMGKISDDPVHNWSAYAAGRTAYFVVTEHVSASTIAALENRYDEFLVEIKDVVVVEQTQTIDFVNDMAMILSAETDDPYGLIGDLIYGLKMFGAEFSAETGEMASVQPVPAQIYFSFSDGWKQSKRVDAMNQ